MNKTIIAKDNDRKSRNGEIDLLRFVFAIVILLFHFGKMLPTNFAGNGNIAVGFYCIVAGVFMAKHAKKILVVGKTDSIGDMTWKYIIHRIRSFYAYYIVAFILSAIFYRMLSEKMDFISLIKGLTKSIPTLSLTFLGLNNNLRSLYVPNTWYLSALLISSFVLFPFLIYKFDTSTKILFPIVSMLILGYVYANNQTIILAWENWGGFLYNGITLSIAEIALGASLFSLIEWIRRREVKSSKATKMLFTALKWGSFIIVFIFSFSPQIKRDYSIHALLYCCVGVVLSLSNLSYNIPATKMSSYLGKCALPIYMFHGFVRYIIQKRNTDGLLNLTPTVFLVSVLLTIIASILLMHLIDLGVKRIKTRKQVLSANDNTAGN